MKQLVVGLLALGWVVMLEPNPHHCQDPPSQWRVIALYRSMGDCLDPDTNPAHDRAVWAERLDLSDTQAVKDMTDSYDCFGTFDWQKKACFELGDPKLRESHQ